jgi:hypothetical protein
MSECLGFYICNEYKKYKIILIQWEEGRQSCSLAALFTLNSKLLFLISESSYNS